MYLPSAKLIFLPILAMLLCSCSLAMRQSMGDRFLSELSRSDHEETIRKHYGEPQKEIVFDNPVSPNDIAVNSKVAVHRYRFGNEPVHRCQLFVTDRIQYIPERGSDELGQYLMVNILWLGLPEILVFPIMVWMYIDLALTQTVVVVGYGAENNFLVGYWVMGTDVLSNNPPLTTRSRAVNMPQEHGGK